MDRKHGCLAAMADDTGLSLSLFPHGIKAPETKCVNTCAGGKVLLRLNGQDMFDYCIRPVQWQKMAAAFNRDHLRAWNNLPVMLSLIGSGPVLCPPDEEDWNPDIAIVLSRHLPACRVSH